MDDVVTDDVATDDVAPAPALGTPATDPTATPGVAPGPLDGADLARRRFFRQFAADVINTAATVVGAAGALQRGTAQAASAILNPTDLMGDVPAAARPNPVAPAGSMAPGPASTAAGRPGMAGTAVSTPTASTFGRPLPAVGYRSAFRVDSDRIVVIDQRRLPFALVEVDCRTAIDVANAIIDGAMTGGPGLGQVAALGLAMSAHRLRATRPYARRAILRAAERTLSEARPTSRLLRAGIERVMARYEAFGELEEDGHAIADAMQAEADAIVLEATDDHGRLANAAAVRVARRSDRPAGILTLGATGAMGGGQFGTALGAIQAATYAERAVHVYVLEGRPGLNGARVAAWELAQAGIAHTLVPDAAAGWLLQGGLVDLVLVGAEAVALNGDVANDTGTYPVAALAGRHGVPVIVCAPLTAVDPAAADGRALVQHAGPREAVVELSGTSLALADTPALNPIVDITPAGLVTAFATEEGLLEGSLGRELEAALARRAIRLPRSAPAARTPEAPAAGPTADPALAGVAGAET